MPRRIVSEMLENGVVMSVLIPSLPQQHAISSSSSYESIRLSNLTECKFQFQFQSYPSNDLESHKVKSYQARKSSGHPISSSPQIVAASFHRHVINHPPVALTLALYPRELSPQPALFSPNPHPLDNTSNKLNLKIANRSLSLVEACEVHFHKPKVRSAWFAAERGAVQFLLDGLSESGNGREGEGTYTGKRQRSGKTVKNFSWLEKSKWVSRGNCH